MIIETIENKLDAILIEVQTRPDRNADLEKRIADAGTGNTLNYSKQFHWNK